MSTEVPLGTGGGGAVLPNPRDPSIALEQAEPVSPATLAEAHQKTGHRLILAGFAITIAGIVLYCIACFAGGMDTDMGDVLFESSEPFTRATLAVLGLGTLVWLVGSFKYLRGSIEAEDDAPGPGGP
ncbi:MAG: hypothetical protein HYY06_24815 [Deltaproteobacteria bacterium]|nr:hypothetical protein [Deltaproteobacteria bacterium]